MNDAATALEALRREIDALDDTLHDAIIRRSGLIERAGEVKRGQKLAKVMIRPAREAQMLYRLVARHAGAYSVPELVHIWRQLIVASLALEGPFSAAVNYTSVEEVELGGTRYKLVALDVQQVHLGPISAIAAIIFKVDDESWKPSDDLESVAVEVQTYEP